MPPRKRARGATQPDVSNADDTKIDTQNDDTQPKGTKRAKRGTKTDIKVDVKVEDDDDLAAPPVQTSKRGTKKTKADITKIKAESDDEDAQQTVSNSISISQSQADHHVITDFFSRNVIKAQKNDAQKARNAYLAIPIDDECPYSQRMFSPCEFLTAASD
jgi:hypothetical protein